MSNVPDHLPADQDLGDPREPTDIVNALINDLTATINRYQGAVDEAQTLGALEVVKHTLLEVMHARMYGDR